MVSGCCSRKQSCFSRRCLWHRSSPSKRARNVASPRSATAWFKAPTRPTRPGEMSRIRPSRSAQERAMDAVASSSPLSASWTRLAVQSRCVCETRDSRAASSQGATRRMGMARWTRVREGPGVVWSGAGVSPARWNGPVWSARRCAPLLLEPGGMPRTFGFAGHTSTGFRVRRARAPGR